jgi:hypothetical protein
MTTMGPHLRTPGPLGAVSRETACVTTSYGHARTPGAFVDSIMRDVERDVKKRLAEWPRPSGAARSVKHGELLAG